MNYNEIQKEEKQKFDLIKKNKKTLIVVSTCIAVTVGFFLLKKKHLNSLHRQDITTIDFLRKASIETVNEYREQVRIRHCNGEVGMWGKLAWIDKVIQNRPENIISRDKIFNLPKREHGWYL